MMLKPAISQILKPGENYSEFVVAVARKARELSAQAEEQHIPLEGKPVSMALDMFASGECKLSEAGLTTDIRNGPED